MSEPRPSFAVLPDRALIRLQGPDWRSFLQGLITQDVEGMGHGELRYGALLTPQGRLLYDLFIRADGEGALLDVSRAGREALFARLKMYRLRAKVELSLDDGAVIAAFDGGRPEGEGWSPDPRLAALGWRGLGVAAPAGAEAAEPDAYDRLRLEQGVADLERDALSDRAYALEANFDLLNGVDFKKGCFVGQETTSRMKRRSVVKSRLLPLGFEGGAPAAGTEVLNGSLRAGVIHSGADGVALALLRLDRAVGAPLTVEGRAVRLDIPHWAKAAVDEALAAA
jgi:tRNA-modifying protein YgfZ